jgi:uncharacterized membrane protein YgcG
MPPSRRRPLILLAVGAALIGYVLWKQHLPTRVYDRVGILSEADLLQLNTYTAAMMNESGVDLRIVIDSLAKDADLAPSSLHEARNLGMGKTSDLRGLLLFADVPSHRLRIEVGPHLEGVFPDAFLGRLLRNHTASYLSDTTFALALQSTIMMLHYRLRESALSRDYDPRTLTAVLDSTRFAAGGGVTFAASVDAPLRIEATDDSALASRFGPTSTAEAALDAFHEWLSLPVYLPRATLFTDDSRDYLSHDIKMTPGYWSFMQYVDLGKRFRVVSRGDRAVAFATDDPLVGPHFFWRTKVGWQVDLMAELVNTRNVAGTEAAWTLTSSGDAYNRAFHDLYVSEWPLLRFREGANEPLVWRGSTH